MLIVMFTLSLTIYEIFVNKTIRTLTLKMKVKVKKYKDGTCAIQLEMFESIPVNFVQNFSKLATYVYARGNTHAHIHTHGQRQGDNYKQNLQSRFA